MQFLETTEQQCELNKPQKKICIHNLCLTLEFKYHEKEN